MAASYCKWAVQQLKTELAQHGATESGGKKKLKTISTLSEQSYSQFTS
jgi:hypothetical protein